MRRGKHIIYIEKGGQARILFLERGLVRFLWNDEVFFDSSQSIYRDIFPFLGVHAIILINFSFSRKANAEKARMLAIVVMMLLRESRILFEHPY